MTINLITFASILHKQATVRSSHEAFSVNWKNISP